MASQILLARIRKGVGPLPVFPEGHQGPGWSGNFENSGGGKSVVHGEDEAVGEALGDGTHPFRRPGADFHDVVLGGCRSPSQDGLEFRSKCLPFLPDETGRIPSHHPFQPAAGAVPENTDRETVQKFAGIK